MEGRPLWRRVSEGSKRILLDAHDAAVARDAPVVEPEHLLAVLLDAAGDPAGIGRLVTGAQVEEVRSRITEHLGPAFPNARAEAERARQEAERAWLNTLTMDILADTNEVLRQHDEIWAAYPGAGVSLGPRAWSVLDAALDETDRLGRSQVQPDTLLLGLLAEGAGKAFDVLSGCGLDLEDVRLRIGPRPDNTDPDDG